MLISLGLDFRNADIRTRERFLPSEERARAFHAEVPPSPLEEVALLPTCNRIEVYAWSRGRATASTTMRAAQAVAGRWMGNPAESRELLDAATLRVEEEAVQHLFRVAAGLESQVLGDIHIMGQVRRAFRDASSAGRLGPQLHRLFETALRCGKAVKRETGLMAGRCSVGSEAAQLLLRRVGAPTGAPGLRVLVLGTGKIGTHAARVLASAGHAELILVNRTADRARLLADTLPGARVRIAPLSRLHDEVAEVDAVLVASGASGPILLAPRLHAARARMGTVGRPLVVVDASMPRNADSLCSTLPGVTVLDLDDLHPGAAAQERARLAAVPEAESVLSSHIADYHRWRTEAAAREALRPLREVLAELCQREVGFAAGEDVADRTATRIVAKLMAQPMAVLREASRRGESVEEVAGALRLLFPGDGTGGGGISHSTR